MAIETSVNVRAIVAFFSVAEGSVPVDAVIEVRADRAQELIDGGLVVDQDAPIAP